MAGLAIRLEGATMRIGVASHALVEKQAGVFGHRFVASFRLMTLHTRDPNVRPGQGKLGFRMVKSRCILPTVERVTLQAIPPQLAAVLILVAGKAVPRQAEEGAVQVPDLDGPPLDVRNVLGLVALLAHQAGVLALQWISRLLVIKSFQRRFPMDQREILTVVFRVTADAVPAGGRQTDHGGVKSSPRRKSLGDLRMALQAPENSRAGSESVAGRALERAAERLVRPGERPR